MRAVLNNWRKLMNAALLRYRACPARMRYSPSASGNATLLDAIKAFWRAAELGPTIGFTTGVLVGLLIPSRDWVAIIIVIFAGALLQTLVEVIDRKCANSRNS